MTTKINHSKSTYRYLWQKLKGYRAKLAFLTLGNIIFAALSISISLACRGIIDSATSHNKQSLMMYGAFLFGLFVVQLILRLGCNSLSEYLKARLENGYRKQIFDSLLTKQYDKVADFHSGELLNRMFSDVQIVVNGIVDIIPLLLNMLTRLIGAVIILIALDRNFVLLFLIGGFAMALVSLFFRGAMKRLHKKVQEKEGLVRSFLQESLESLLIIKVFGVAQKMSVENNVRQTEHFHARMKRRTASIFANAGFSFVFQMGYLYAIIWGAGQIFTGTMSYGTLTAILQLVNQIQTPFAQISGLFPQVYGVLASAERIRSLEDLPCEPSEALDSILTYDAFTSICFTNVNFSYGRTMVLADVNCQINKGDFVAITGLSGGGKSTMFLLMLGAYMPSSGEIHFHDNSDNVWLTGQSTRPLFSYVPQGNHLFSGTLYDNITLIANDTSQSEIEQALIDSCAADFIPDLPDGLQTKIGEHGHGLSEGQVQRIAVARALLSKAPILLLDEATSALDEATEAQMLQNLAKRKDITCIIVTHRKAALAICNKHLEITDTHVQEITL